MGGFPPGVIYLENIPRFLLSKQQPWSYNKHMCRQMERKPKTHFFYVCTAEATDFSNFAFEVQLKILHGDCGGMIFRADSNSGKLYFFEVCQDGRYLFSRYLDYTGNNVKDLAGGTSAAITTGLNQANVIAVVAQGSTLSIYVNKQKIASASDSTFNHGQIGLLADSNNQPTEVAFTDVKVWMY